jgi:hypothetical protein
VRHIQSPSVFHWFIALLIATCPMFTGSSWAQEVPFTGIVSQSQTDVRAGAADRFYRVGELDRGQLVQVDEVISGWNKVVPPQGVFSYISKAFVDARGDGSAGTVNTDASKVYAADVNGPAGSYRVQVLLNEGDGVQIVAEEGSHYKIVAPSGAYVYLPPGSVRRALAMETAAAQQPEPTPPAPVQAEPAEPEPVEPQPVVEPAEPVAPVVVAKPEPAPVEVPVVAEPAVVDSTDNQAEQDLADMLDGKTSEPQPAAQAASLAELEAQMAPLFALPLEEQPLDDMIAKYRALRDEGGLSKTDQHIVATRLAALKHNREIAEGLAEIAQATEPAETQASAPEVDPVSYDAVGRLLASSVYDGKTLPRMYRLADPATGRAVAYVRPDGKVNTTRFLGRLVGIKGDRAYDPSLKLKVIRVEQMDVLEAVR